MPIDSHLPQADPFSLVSAFKRGKGEMENSRRSREKEKKREVEK
jgi:hypothetical protein